MNNKWKAALALSGVLILSIAVPPAIKSFTREARYHQHMEAALRPEQAPADTNYQDGFSTHLPILSITTDEEIPGRFLVDEDGSYQEDENGLIITTAKDGSDVVIGSLAVVDHEDTLNTTGDDPTFTSKISIRVRGNSSRGFDKPGYKVVLLDETGLINNRQPLLGMDAHHEWALHGPILDKTLIRNYMWYNVGGEFMDYTPNVRFCELMVNGEYEGVYVLLETITAGQDGARLELSVSKKNNTFSGFLFRRDRGSGNEVANIEPFTQYMLQHPGVEIDIVYPGATNLSPEMAERIRQEISDVEKAIYSYDYDTPDEGYIQYLDVESFMDYFILNEVSSNYDAGIFSTYMYKGLDERYRMVVWDFNSASDNYQEQAHSPTGFQMHRRAWLMMLMKSDYFTHALVERYRSLRTSYLSDEYLNAYIDDTLAYLGPAVERNFARWGYTFAEPGSAGLDPSTRNPVSHEDAVKDMRDFLMARTAWMDENIETLYQYSAESKVKKFNEHND